MVENSSSPRVPRKGRRVVGPTRKNKEAIDEAGDLIECSGKYCRSCTAGVIADCVALCCCPCALLNLLTLALVKVPWKMGRRCLGFGKKKRNRVEMERKVRSRVDDDRNNSRGKMRVEEQEMWGFSRVFGEKENFYDDDEEVEMGNFSARFEAEKVWLELYQVGHLGFGRVSFTGI
ncbi:hypothetical protein ES332_A09G033600v1 [Gossypium tomentosum]|uniref:Uncharacterized protein n=1 Tax=Gossypium tomentosum TaxID=34277 RepID=A0A5D2NY37_GOSTO|nr:hypothetical protein ES332_A09G033600v1 [Gossypium tomentosum]